MEPMSLYEQLEAYNQSDYYPLHMPGHKRNAEIAYFPVGLDITEIDGFDNLHHARGVLLEAQKRAARLYHAKESCFLVNGSTAGILAAVSAGVSRGGQILLARNSHSAAYHAVYLRDLSVRYVYPQTVAEYGICGGIAPCDIEEELKNHPGIRAVFLTSPTYEGILSNIRQIADITHRNGALLIVDEAHGAHLGISGSYFPASALSQGADLVIQSLHKTLPAPTQTAVLHVNSDRVDVNSLHRYLRIYQSSSPSYVLMAAMDACIRLMQERGRELFGVYVQRLEHFYQRAETLSKLHVITPEEMSRHAHVAAMDASKLCIATNRTVWDGSHLYNWLLKQCHLQLEMAAGNYALAMTSVMDTNEGFERLFAALEKADTSLDAKAGIHAKLPELPRAVVELKSSETEARPKKTVLFAESADCIACEYRYVYPPGVPFIVPGERITRQLVEQVREYSRMGLTVLGMEQGDQYITVVE